MANIQIAVLNRSTVVTDAEAEKVTKILEKQVKNDFAPVWGIDADLTFVGVDKQPTAGFWWLTILDNTDDATALGYHDLTDEGLPIGKVFAKTDKMHGNLWSVTASHELLEMLADPGINLTALDEHSSKQGILYAYEVCDACEADSDGYPIDGIQVSDFVYPSWFEPFWKTATKRPQGLKFDHQDKIKEPFELLAGGYIGARDLTFNHGWTQIFGSETTRKLYAARAVVGSRRERRRTPRENWLLSKVLIKA